MSGNTYHVLSVVAVVQNAAVLQKGTIRMDPILTWLAHQLEFVQHSSTEALGPCEHETKAQVA